MIRIRRTVTLLAGLLVAITLFAGLPLALATDEPGAATLAASSGDRPISRPVIEPSTLVLVGIGLVGVAVLRARYRTAR